MYARVLARRGKLQEAEYKLTALRRARPGEDCRAARALKGLRAALTFKDEGNAAYKRGEVERAAAQYTQALEADVEGCLKPTLLANRAQARLQAERFADALGDIDGAITLDADNTKLLLRRAACHVALKQPAKAKLDYEAVLKLDPYCEVAKAYVEQAQAGEKRRARTGGDGADAGDPPEEEEEEIDPYHVLGLVRSCNAAEIKSAYRKLALKWHPDKHAEEAEEARAEAERRFQEVNLANTLLSDPYKRRQYDAGGRVRDVMK